MPRRGSPYGGEYQRARRLLLAGRPLCSCGQAATEADHVPPLALHRHVNGSGCCSLRPACWTCQRRQAIELANLSMGRRSRYERPSPPEPSRSW